MSKVSPVAVAGIVATVFFYFWLFVLFLLFNELIPHNRPGGFGPPDFFGFTQALIVSFLITCLFIYRVAPPTKKLLTFLFFILINALLYILFLHL